MIEIYTKEQCIYCAMAKSQLLLRGVAYIERKLHEDFDREFVLEKFAPQTTFPFIVIDNVLIGGYTDLLEYYKKGTV